MGTCEPPRGDIYRLAHAQPGGTVGWCACDGMNFSQEDVGRWFRGRPLRCSCCQRPGDQFLCWTLLRQESVALGDVLLTNDKPRSLKKMKVLYGREGDDDDCVACHAPLSTDDPVRCNSCDQAAHLECSRSLSPVTTLCPHSPESLRSSPSCTRTSQKDQRHRSLDRSCCSDTRGSLSYS